MRADEANLFQPLDVNSSACGQGEFVAFCIPAAFSHMGLRGFAGMVCLGAGLMLLSGRACEASCGDYVLLRGAHLKTHDAVPTPKPTPCNSPACRGEVPPLPAPQVPAGGSSAEQPLALFAESLHLEGDSPNCDWLTSSEHVRPGFRSPLERPPSR